MDGKAQRLWARARECRIQAQLAGTSEARKLLLKRADDMEADATKIEAESPEPS